MSDSQLPKTYVRPDGTFVLTCPHCGHQKTIHVDALKGHKHKLQVKCGCQKVFTVALEFRKKVRKQVYLKGTNINHSQEDRSGYLTIHNISVTGLAFASLDLKNFHEGNETSLEFTLDDEHQTEIKKEAIVRRVRQHDIGCEFEDSAEDFGSPLGYYVHNI